jgi:DNA-directed RNA polymerase specialized sigma24 family protein
MTLAELYVLCAPGMRVVAWQSTGCRDTAEDVVQDTFVRIMARFDAVNRTDSAQERYAWVVLRNLLKDHARRGKRWDTTSDWDAEHDPWPRIDAGLDAPSALDAAGRFAPELARWMRGDTSQEIGDARGVLPNCAKTRVYRAVDRARRALVTAAA